MHAVKGGWVGQTFALAKCNDSGGKKSRIRRSKEERKGMVESFIKTYQNLNNGNFPSLNLTHKEVGGSFYTVREIVREIIQENRVLGSGKLSLEEQHTDHFVEQYPLGTISTEPQTSLSTSPNGSPVPDQHDEGSSEVHLFSELQVKPEQQGFNNGEIINGNHVIVMNEEADRPEAVEVQETEPQEIEKRMEEVAASDSKVTQMADVMVEAFPLPPVTKPAENLNGNSSNVREINGTCEEKTVEKVLLEPEHDPGNGISLPDRITSSNDSSLGDDKEVEKSDVQLLEQGSDLVREQAVENFADLAIASSLASITKESILQDAKADMDVKAIAETKVASAQNAMQTKSLDDNYVTASSSLSIAKEIEIEDKVVVINSRASQKGSNPTLNRINLESWGEASKNQPEPETNPLWAFIKSFLAAFVRF
ncbi:DNA BINDING PROTEIN [Salix purpurea]|uniref:DNA BINDING PROTEIN n=1 Tax=Salix purpurea TaxID=77065 RepID=A0A9Q0UCA1_SALPP|nr:DNA BINDING PROTEIN [Salix purpurea]